MAAAYLIAIASAAIGQTSVVSNTGTLTAELRYPGRLASAPGGGVYVTDQPTGRVLEYDPAGTVVNTYAIDELPVGIAVHSDGRLYIARRDGNVGVYQPGVNPDEIVHLGTLDPTVFAGTGDPTNLTMIGPNDIAIHPDTGEIFVVDSLGHRILVFDDTEGRLVRAWGAQGSGLDEFQSPQAIAIDAALDRVYVTDADNFRVLAFDTAGVYRNKFGYRMLYIDMTQNAWFARSEGIAVDSCSNIYVTDALMGTVRVFDAVGNELDLDPDPLVDHVPAIGFGAGPGQLRVPCDVLIDSDTLYVASTNNAAVEVYDVACTPAPPLTRMSPGSDRVTVSAGDVIGRSKKRLARAMRFPDNPFDIVEAIASGVYSSRLDVNGDRTVDMKDLELTVAQFGAGTIADFLNPEAVGSALRDVLEPPHMIGIDYTCGRCHFNDAPGGMLTADGQENLCLSCHSGSFVAMADPIGGTGNSHPWGLPADEGDVAGPVADGLIDRHLDNGDVRCGTCHDPHSSSTGEPYLRVTAESGQLCKECHTGVGAPVEHGAQYTKYCTDCHDMHAIGDNLDLVAEQFLDTYYFGDVDVSFTDHAVGVGPGAFVDPDPDVRGVCEACHAYPPEDFFGDPLPLVPQHTMDMQVCTNCHQHHNGFVPNSAPASGAVRGGLMYDKWWKVNGAPEPTGDHPLYPPIGQRSGSTTYRCKECHGWDYIGRDGRYESGSHYTGIIGVLGAAGSMTAQEIFDIIKNDPATTTNGHDFGAYGLSDTDINDLVAFITTEVIDTSPYINTTGSPGNYSYSFNGDIGNGFAYYSGALDPVANCSLCHGADGRAIEFHTDEYLGTLANDNPQETLHKIRFGQPATAMCSFVNLSHGDQDAADVGAYAETLPIAPAVGGDVVRGGLMYDKWWKVNGAPEPTGDHPLYPPIGQRSGSTTYRCKECHGWDYIGRDGRYESGSHYTGIIGVLGAAGSMTDQQIFDIIKNPDGDGTGGTTVNGHDFGAYGLSDTDINDLVAFITTEVIDTSPYINTTGTPGNYSYSFNGNPATGATLYAGGVNPVANCTLCHGIDGTQIDFGGGKYVGTVANDNPQETLHKIRLGQPATAMCSYVNLGLSDQQAADVGAHCETLPQ